MEYFIWIGNILSNSNSKLYSCWKLNKFRIHKICSAFKYVSQVERRDGWYEQSVSVYSPRTHLSLYNNLFKWIFEEWYYFNWKIFTTLKLHPVSAVRICMFVGSATFFILSEKICFMVKRRKYFPYKLCK